jgi:mRNA-degrading endonuclease RelE of RelBE toxin-antitoxin system
LLSSRARKLKQRRATRSGAAQVVLARPAQGEPRGLNWRLLVDAVADGLGLPERELLAGHELHGRLRGLRSLRVDTYRISYQLADGDRTVRVVAIGHRSVAYAPIRDSRMPKSRGAAARSVRGVIAAQEEVVFAPPAGRGRGSRSYLLGL